MVKKKGASKRSRKQARRAQERAESGRVSHITAQTTYAECTERLTAFGGLLALVKFLDLIEFKELFERHYVRPGRRPKLGDYRMIMGLLTLLFVGFQRIWHLSYIRTDAMICGMLRVKLLPAATTFWRYLHSLTIIQSQSLLRLSGHLRERVWRLCAYSPTTITVNIDTTVSTVYGQTEGMGKMPNKRHLGKPSLRPVLCFLGETREFLCGSQRRGYTMSGDDIARLIRKFRGLLPECVKQIRVHGDGEFMAIECIKACEDAGFLFTFANRRCTPPFAEDQWYTHGDGEYNECMYTPLRWEHPRRFIIKRMLADKQGTRQLPLRGLEKYVYRRFATNETMRPHEVVADYDKRADAENLIAEAQHEGLLALPSKTFQANHAFFQIVMLSYNLWRWMKLLAGHAEQKNSPRSKRLTKATMPTHTIRIARLKMLFVAAKIRFHGNRDEIRYSVHESRAAGLMDFLKYLDNRRHLEGLAS